ncbi:ribulose-phosphate 3-epimerase [Collinsella sp. zg1085]|uniref:ribulose-phosphate 3-epimerase n=1 Tax=Collinsella sp. zg1085 TaxID=2844380 RepID=UPI001C0AE0B0|nr:ribulose-phosphate 3-epimerase [Collinsella sp. zg1085]QWT17018.1 ribulose-phosphate 3-epimerase [Collinsella sp. zg1085]
MSHSSVLIAPSILSADMAYLARDLERIHTADLIHFDTMDGHFTKNLTFGPDVLRAVKRVSDIPVDVHMMVSDPDTMADWYVDAGADIITIHLEASVHLNRTIQHLKKRGVRAGVVLNPATPVLLLEDIIEDLDIVLLMSVNPGFGGQSFIPNTLSKIRSLKSLCQAHNVAPLIEVDGGISAANAEEVARAGANVLVAGSAVFSSSDPAAEIVRLRELGSRAYQGVCA